MAEERRIIHEITPLMGKDVLYIADRHKKEFTYPIHNHSVFELNFVENAKGVKRIVGDSQEVIDDYDLWSDHFARLGTCVGTERVP